MPLRLDRVLTAPGVVANAKTWTLLADDDALYVLPLGPGRAQSMPSTNPLSLWLARKMAARMFAAFDRKIAAAEARLAAEGAAAFADGAKGARRIARGDVARAAFEDGRLVVEGDGEAWSFYGTGVLDDRDRRDELAAFAEALAAWQRA